MGQRLVHVHPLPFHPSLWVHKTSPYEYLIYNSCNTNSTLFHFSPCPVHYFAKRCDRSQEELRLTGESPKALRMHTHTHIPLPQRGDLSVPKHNKQRSRYRFYAWPSTVWMQTTCINHHANAFLDVGIEIKTSLIWIKTQSSRSEDIWKQESRGFMVYSCCLIIIIFLLSVCSLRFALSTRLHLFKCLFTACQRKIIKEICQSLGVVRVAIIKGIVQYNLLSLKRQMKRSITL